MLDCSLDVRDLERERAIIAGRLGAGGRCFKRRQRTPGIPHCELGEHIDRIVGYGNPSPKSPRIDHCSSNERCDVRIIK